MTESGPHRTRPPRGGPWLVVWALLALMGCAEREPQVSVTDLNWACGADRCTVTFRLTAGDGADEDLLVRVRAYAGEGVADREIVGEHRERVRLRSGQTRRLSVAFETAQPADRVRVIPARDR